MNNTQKRWWDLTAALLLLAAFMIVAFRLTDTKWADGLAIVIPLTFIGCLLGFALGHSNFDRRIVWWMSLLYTLFFVLWQLTTLIPDTLGLSWAQRFSMLATGLWKDLNIFLKNKPLSDSFLFITLMAVLLWVNSLTTAYTLVRYGKPWQGLIVAGAAMAVIDLYHPPLAASGIATAIFAVLALVLVTRVFYLKQAEKWKEDRVSEDSDTGANLVRVTFLVAVGLVFFAWKAPSVVKAFVPETPANGKLIETWQNFRHNFENLTAPLHGSAQTSIEYYGDTFSLGTGSVLTDQTIFTVSPSVKPNSGLSYYWRMRSYDTYQDGQWTSTVDDTYSYVPGVTMVFDQYADRTQVQFQFTPAKNLGMLFSPGLFLSSNLKTSLSVNRRNGLIEDITNVQVNPVVKAGTPYTVDSSISTATIADMEAAGTDYPDWVNQYYLQLPDDFPVSISNLATQITAGLETPYEKAEAITDWLRNNITYSAVIPDPPPGRDAIEWMLFDEKQAFCNYYASAEVLMLRSLGVPARWVVGYAQGQPENGASKISYQVRDKDRHAWPEVFFPGLGWVEFEPTALQPSLSRPSSDANIDNAGSINPASPAQPNDPREKPTPSNGSITNLDTGYHPESRFITASLLIFGALVIFLIGMYTLTGRVRRKPNPEKTLPVILERRIRERGWKVPYLVEQWSEYIQLSRIEQVYYWMAYLQRFLSIRTPANYTPSEQIREIERRLPGSKNSARKLLREYQKGIYSPHPANVSVARIAMRQLWRLALDYRLQKILSWITRRKTPEPGF